MSEDRERGSNAGPGDQAEEIEGAKQREALGRFGKYTAPAILALLLSAQSASASI